MSRVLLTPSVVRREVARISRLPGDTAKTVAEAALHFVVLRAIAEGTVAFPEALAREAIRTDEIPFARVAA